MYLYLEKYDSCSQYDKDFAEKRKNFYPKELKELEENLLKYNFMSKTTQYQVAYWRKANAIHRFFVNKCAKGVDDCKPVWVDKKILKELVEKCREIIANPKKAIEELPTQGGFFFGSLDYDEYYMNDLEQTVEMLEPIVKFLEEHKGYSVIYEASW